MPRPVMQVTRESRVVTQRTQMPFPFERACKNAGARGYLALTIAASVAVLTDES